MDSETTDAQQGVDVQALHHSLLELFDELSFTEKWRKVLYGLKQPKESGDYKFAKLQLLRLMAPASAVVVPVVAILLMGLLAAIAPAPDPQVKVQIMEPQKMDKLDKIEELKDEPPEPPDPVQTDFTPNVTVSDNPMPGPPTEFSPQPAAFDSVAIVRSPVIMRGIYGSRNPGSRGVALKRFGGLGTEDTVMRGLRWLKKNQESEGCWPKTKPAMTALALLSFLAHGETPSSDEFGQCVERAIRWLVENQTADGLFKGRDGHDYTQPIVAYALAEAFGITKVPMVKYAAEKAIDVIIKGQHASGGWNYNCNQQDRDDTSYMGWCGQALKAAYMAGLSNEGLDKAMKKALDGYRKNYQDSNGYGGFGYTSPGTGGLTGVGVLCMQLLGAAKSKEVTGGLATLEKTTFNWEGGGTYNQNYYWYYITQAKFHAGGATWENWNKLFSPVLVRHQTIVPKAIEDAEGKSVDIGFWEMANGITGHTDGVVMDTCLCLLQLQVYYRYLPTYQAPVEIEQEQAAQDKGDINIDINI